MKLISLFVFIECPRQDSFVPTHCPPNELLAAALGGPTLLRSDETNYLAPRSEGRTWHHGSWSDDHLGMLVRTTAGTVCDENIQNLATSDLDVI